MMTFLFALLMLMIFGKIFIFAIKAAWGVSKIIFSVILLPLFLIVLVLEGLLALAFPLLLVIGVVSLFVFHK